MKEWKELADLILYLECLNKLPVETDDILIRLTEGSNTPVLYLRVNETSLRPVFAGTTVLCEGKWEEKIISYIEEIISLMLGKIKRNDGVDPADVDFQYEKFVPIEITDELFLELNVRYPNAAKRISYNDNVSWHLIPVLSKVKEYIGFELNSKRYLFVRDYCTFATIYHGEVEQVLDTSSGIKFIPSMLRGYV